MPSDSVVIAANVCQAAVPVISLLAYVPQWTKLHRTKSSASISARSWIAWSMSTSFALFYAITQLLLTGTGWTLVISTSIGLCFVLYTLLLVVRYRTGTPARDLTRETRDPGS